MLTNLEMNSILQGLGVAGFVTYICTFACVQFGKISAGGVCFSCLNVLAASLVLLGLIADFNLGSFLIQISYIGISAVVILRLLLRRSRQMDHKYRSDVSMK